MYMKWDYNSARFMKNNHAFKFQRGGDWIYLDNNVRVNSMLEFSYWGELDERVQWLCENFNGFEFVTGEAQISICPNDGEIQIMVFGCATPAQLATVDDLFKYRGTIKDIFIDYKQYEFDPSRNELRVNAGAWRGIVEAKQKDRSSLVKKFEDLNSQEK